MNTNFPDLSKAAIGIELGSTRVKCVLVDCLGTSLATGVANWENEISPDGYWTYSENLIWKKIEESFENLQKSYMNKYKSRLDSVYILGVSAMMHGLMAFDKDGNLLTPFRTWRNNNTREARAELSQLFKFNIPERWSVAHVYQAILDNEKFVNDISFITTLSGYITWKLTGQKVIGIGDASGMFPIDSETNDYNNEMINIFNKLIYKKGISWKIEDILPEVKVAGNIIGSTSYDSCKLLDSSGLFKYEVKVVPPEGDAGTGMVATNCIKEKTANISIGTSAFSMIVLDKKLKSYYEHVDVVQTPDGKDVAMIHINNCGSEINAWIKLFKEFLDLFGIEISDSEIFEKLFTNSDNSHKNTGNILSYGFHSGENIFDVNRGMPILLRDQENDFTLANLVKSLLISSFLPLRIGHDILNENEDIEINKILAHGGLFKTERISQEIISEVLDFPVSTFKTAGEGGAWGMAILALYANKSKYESLQEFLNNNIFKDINELQYERNLKIKEEVDNYYINYKNHLGDIRNLINKN